MDNVISNKRSGGAKPRRWYERSGLIALLTGLLVLGVAQRAAGEPVTNAEQLSAGGGLECDRTAILPVLSELDMPYSEMATCQQWVEYGVGGPEEIPLVTNPGDGLAVYYTPEGGSVLLLSAGAKAQHRSLYAEGLRSPSLWVFGRQGDRTRPSSWAATQLRSSLGTIEPLSQFAPDEDTASLRLEWAIGGSKQPAQTSAPDLAQIH